MPDIVCLGESLAAFRPARPGQSLATAEDFSRGAGGAESNVACTLARAGHRVRWVSRLGRDGFGDRLLAVIAAAGVDVSAVRRDPARPTGIYFRTDGDRGRDLETVYYRAGSAASAMSPATVPPESWTDARVLHLTGITAALSADCAALLRELTAPRPGRPLISFDVNHRPQLWPAGRAGPMLRDLADASDLVFVGEDEAEAVWGITGGPAAIRAALPGPATVVVKRGARDAVLLTRGRTIRVSAPRAEVVAPVGAGDAFAAGYLSALLRDRPEAERLRHAHLFAAAALGAPGDLAPPPPRADADRLAALPAAGWAALRLPAGWPQDRPGTPEAAGRQVPATAGPRTTGAAGPADGGPS
jgi:2-dehydro-3-deoxygluconokinase